MARRSSRSSQGPTRSHYVIAKPRLFGPINLSSLGVADRRSFYPDPLYRPADYSGLRLNRSLVTRPQKGSRSLLAPDRVSFRVPERVYICARREQRKQVLFAKRVAGGRGSRAPKRRNVHSEVSCR